MPAAPSRSSSNLPPAPVDVVLFDAVGTLLMPHPTVAVAYAQAANRHGVSLDEAIVSRRFRAAFNRQEQADAQHHGHQTSELRERQRWQSIVAEVFPEAADPEALLVDLWDHFARPEHWRLFDDIQPALALLAARGITAALASNFDCRLPAIWQALAPAAWRHAPVFVSSQVGWRKPHRQFFLAIERQLGVSPNRLLLVGDDPANDHSAATAAGWQALLVDRRRQSLDRALATRLIGSNPA